MHTCAHCTASREKWEHLLSHGQNSTCGYLYAAAWSRHIAQQKFVSCQQELAKVVSCQQELAVATKTYQQAQQELTSTSKTYQESARVTMY